MKRQINFAINFFLISVLFSSPLAGEEMPVPLDLQAQLLLKILTFDRNLERRADSAVVVGIVYNADSKDSEKANSAFSKALEKYSEKKINGLPMSYVSFKYLSWSDLSAKMKTHDVSVIYVTPGNSSNLRGVVKAARADSVLTATGVTEYLQEGISLGIGLKGKNPQILISLPSAKAEGADFSSQLLKLAKIIE